MSNFSTELNVRANDFLAQVTKRTVCLREGQNAIAHHGGFDNTGHTMMKWRNIGSWPTGALIARSVEPQMKPGAWV